ncbi:MAG: hypothetical protein AW07_04422 [Candidatus Accumulibacter sp. SK-11]|nr:MAG: hypothetical protein AW07_04422 [Candidatus Accumulibacter sp. SK-11]
MTRSSPIRALIIVLLPTFGLPTIATRITSPVASSGVGSGNGCRA